MLDLPRPPSQWAFVGRKAELELALTELDAARRGLVIAGPAGSGRTRLAREISEAAAERGLAVVWRSGDALAPEQLTAPGKPRRGVLVVDDAHLLASSAGRRLLSLAQESDLFLIVTLLSGARGSAAVRALWKEAIVPRVDLRALDERALAELLESALAARVELGTCRLLTRACQGNLVWLRELLREGLAQGALDRHAGVWRWTGPLLLGPPLRELVLEDARSLPEAAYAALESIAVAGKLELALLRAPREDGSLELLERRGLIAIDRDGSRSTAMVSQPLCAEAVRHAMPRIRSLELHRSLGAALLRLGLRRSEDRYRAALFLLEGDPAAGAPYFAGAAEKAWLRGDAALAERFSRAALNGADAALARHFLAEALADQSRFDEAFAAWDALDALDIDDALRARAANSRAGILAFARGRMKDAREILERAEARITSEELRGRLAAMRASLGVATLPPDRIVADTERVLLDPDLPPYVESRMLTSQFIAANLLGRFDRVLAQRSRALRAAQRMQTTNPFAEIWVHVNSFYALLFSADLDGAESLAAEQREAHAEEAFVATRGYWTYALGLTHLWRGRVEVASALLREAASLLLAYDNGVRQAVLFDLAVARACAGASAEADDALRDGEACRPAPPTMLPGRDRARAFVHAARGERSAARELLIDASRRFRESGHTLPAILALHDAVRFGAGLEATRTLRNLASHTDGALLATLADHAHALATHDADALDDVSWRLEACGVLFYAADAARAACEQHAKVGRTAAALASRRTFERLASQCGGAVLPPLALEDPLTRREREIAELAARGACDRAIAARLSLSIRTVNAHLRAVYRKLDVEGRSGLGVLLAPRGDAVNEKDRAK